MPDIILYAIPFFLGTVILEAVVSSWLKVKDVKGFEKKDTFASLGMGIGNVLVNLMVKGGVFASFTFLHQFRLFDIGTVWWAWVLLLFGEDLCYYAFHRASHEVRFLWAAHVNHHSSEHYNLSTALRQSWTTPLTSFWFWLPLPLLGFEPWMIVTQQSISLLYQYWIHTEWIKKLPFGLEGVLNSPSHHRVHHGSNAAYLDRNHGGILIIWDRLFGTFAPEREKVVYGLTKNIHTFNLVKIAFHEWAALLKDMARPNPLWVRLQYALRPPGWSPDGSTLTSDQLRATQQAQA